MHGGNRSKSSLYILADNSVCVSAMLNSSAAFSFSRSIKTSRMRFCSLFSLMKALRYFLIGRPVCRAASLSRSTLRSWILSMIAVKCSFMLALFNAELSFSVWTVQKSRSSCLSR